VSTPTNRWNDDRLDELNGRLGRVEPVITEVAVLRTEMHTLTRELRANTTATQEVAEQMEKAQIEPLDRRRRFWGAIVIGSASAGAGGVLVLIGTLLAGH
jgi:hypothetical protein